MKENNLKLKNLINFGPSGRAVAQPIEKSLLDNCLLYTSDAADE